MLEFALGTKDGALACRVSPDVSELYGRRSLLQPWPWPAPGASIPAPSLLDAEVGRAPGPEDPPPPPPDAKAPGAARLNEEAGRRRPSMVELGASQAVGPEP